MLSFNYFWNHDCKPNGFWLSKLPIGLIIMVLTIALISGCSLFKKDIDPEDATAEELYAEAKKSMEKKNWTNAIESLRILEGKYPYGVYAEQAQLDTIYAYYRSEQVGLALAAADRFIKLNPTHQSVDYAYYLKGLSSFEEDKSLFGTFLGKNDLSDRDATSIRNAMTAFEEVYTLFPDSQYAPDARKRVKYLNGALAKSEVMVAKYYYSRAAYVAVVNRAKEIIENYSTTPSVEPALALMMFSYQNMGFEELAGDSRRVLELNYPKSEYLIMDVASVSFSNSANDKAKKGNEDKGWFKSLKNFFKRDKS